MNIKYFFLRRRSLADSSNVYLDESLNANGKSNEKNSSKIHVPDTDEDDDDALLTQALNEQEAKINTTQKSPPAKKVSSFNLI